MLLLDALALLKVHMKLIFVEVLINLISGNFLSVILCESTVSLEVYGILIAS